MAMTDAQLRARVRELMAAGVLPREPAPIQRPVPPAPTGPKPHMFVGDSLLEPAVHHLRRACPPDAALLRGWNRGARPRSVPCSLAAGARSAGSGEPGQGFSVVGVEHVWVNLLPSRHSEPACRYRSRQLK